MAGDVVGGQTRPHTLSPSALDAAAADADTAPTHRALLTGRAPDLPAAAPGEGLRGPVRGFGVGRGRVLRAFLFSGGALTRLGESSSAPALARSPCTSPLPGGIVHAVRADAPGRGFVVVLAAGARPSLVAVAVRILVPALAILFASVLRAGGRVHPDPQVPVGESPGRIPENVLNMSESNKFLILDKMRGGRELGR